MRDGKLFEQTISEVEVDIEAEKYMVEVMKGAIESDAREKEEYRKKIEEIDALNVPEEYKVTLKQSIQIYSGSNITQEMLSSAEAKVAEIEAVLVSAKTEEAKNK